MLKFKVVNGVLMEYSFFPARGYAAPFPATPLTTRMNPISDRPPSPKSSRDVKIERASISLLFWPPDLLRVRQSLSVVAKLHPLAECNLDTAIHVSRFKNASTVFRS